MGKMTVKRARKVRDALLISGFVIMLLALIWEPFLYIGGTVTFSCLIPHFLFNKCPRCGKQLGRSGGAFCPFCGRSLDD